MCGARTKLDSQSLLGPVLRDGERIRTAEEVKKYLRSEVCHCSMMMGKKGSGLSCAEMSLSFQMVKLAIRGFSALLGIFGK